MWNIGAVFQRRSLMRIQQSSSNSLSLDVKLCSFMVCSACANSHNILPGYLFFALLPAIAQKISRKVALHHAIIKREWLRHQLIKGAKNSLGNFSILQESRSSSIKFLIDTANLQMGF